MWNSSFCANLCSPVTSSLLGSNIDLNILFSNTLNVSPSKRGTEFTVAKNKVGLRCAIQGLPCLREYKKCAQNFGQNPEGKNHLEDIALAGG
jgi:hypothetical protein